VCSLYSIQTNQKPNVGFEVFMVVRIRVTVFCVVTPRSDGIGHQHFGGPCCFHLHVKKKHVSIMSCWLNHVISLFILKWLTKNMPPRSDTYELLQICHICHTVFSSVYTFSVLFVFIYGHCNDYRRSKISAPTAMENSLIHWYIDFDN